MKRIVLFVITNLAVMLVLSATLRILGVDRYITANGLNLNALLIFSVVVGFTGAIISLLISSEMIAPVKPTTTEKIRRALRFRPLAVM